LHHRETEELSSEQYSLVFQPTNQDK